MAGTKEGGIKTRNANLAKNPDYYKIIGSKGGKKTMKQGAAPKGFAANPELARLAGSKGGRISRRNRGKSTTV